MSSSMEESSACGSLDTEAFIRLVQAYKCIYDIKDAAYKNRRARMRAWEEIGALLWPDWETFSKQLKESKAHIMKIKWKSLKDAFMRHRRKESEHRSGAAACAPSRYIHAEQLSFLIPCTEMRSTDSSWVSSPRQEEEEEDSATQAPEPCASTMTQSPPPPVATPTATSPTLSVPPSQPTIRRRTILRGRRARPEPQEDRLIGVLEAMSHPIPKLSCEALYLLSLEDKIKEVPKRRRTELYDAINRCIDSFIPPTGSAQQHPPPPATPTHTYPHQTYPQAPILLSHHSDAWQPRPHSPFVYPSTSQIPLGFHTRAMREGMQEDEPQLAHPHFQNL